MTRAVFVVLLLVFISPLLQSDEPPKKEKPPYRNADAALPLFAEEFVDIAQGKAQFPATFQMGSNATAEEKPAHEVKLSRPFAMAKYEVTQELYQAVMGKNPAKWQGPRNSVEMVSWKDANEFCSKVTTELRKRKLIGEEQEIRLPTEAEWEYCCRAGTKSAFSFPADAIKEHCWYRDNSKGYDPAVGSKKPNPWGLHEMHGYVSEWCLDSWHDSYKGAPSDGSAWMDDDAKKHVIRGGSYADAPERCRSAARSGEAADYRMDTLGFRCVKAQVRK